MNGKKDDLPVSPTHQAPQALFGTLKSRQEIEEELYEGRDRP
jgi:hypothetical protein